MLTFKGMVMPHEQKKDKTYNVKVQITYRRNVKRLSTSIFVKPEDLEFYSARHSWATIAINKVRIDKYTVHSALNHLDESMKVTDIYIERDFSTENSANTKVLEYVFRQRDTSH